MSEPGDTLDLWDYRRRVEAIYRDVKEYSTGMRQRFKLAAALICHAARC